jgi:hypothetical protein
MGKRKSSYERLDHDSGYSEPESQPLTRSESEEEEEEDDDDYMDSGEGESFEEVEEFSWLVYAVFTLLGMAMLWSWYALHFSSTPALSNTKPGTCSLPPGHTSRNASNPATGS